MAKPTILKERGTGEVLYPHTLASLVQTSSGERVEDVLSQKQEVLTTSDDLSISEDNELLLTDMAKKRLFIDMWNAAWKINNVVYGKYDLANAPDAEHPFMGNEIWMTYEEAMTVMEASSVNSNIAPYARIKGTLARTHTPIYVRQTCSFVEFARDCTQFEVLHIETSSANTISAFNYAFAYCIKLKEIKGVLFASATNFDNAFFQCRELQTINLRYLRANVSFAWSPNLSLASLQYLVANAANTSAITVTVHKIVYLKLTAEPFKSTRRATGLPVSITAGQANSWFRGGTFPWDNMVVPDGLVTGDTIVVELSINNENNAPAWAIGTVTKIDGTQITIKSIDWSYGAMPTGDTLGGAHQAQWNQVLVDAVAKDISFATL